MAATKYSKDLVKKAEEWVSTYGLNQPFGKNVTEYTIAMAMGRTAHFEYMKNHTDYAAAIEKGRARFTEKTISLAENGLKELLQGSENEESTTKYVTGPDGKTPIIAEKKVKKTHTAPNTAAVIFALTNLQPDKWKNRQNTDLTTNGKDVTPPPSIVVADKDQQGAIEELLKSK